MFLYRLPRLDAAQGLLTLLHLLTSPLVSDSAFPNSADSIVRPTDSGSCANIAPTFDLHCCAERSVFHPA